MKKCPAPGCATENDDDAKFCKECTKDIRLVPIQKKSPYQKEDYWGGQTAAPSQKPTEQIAPDTRRYVIQEYYQYINRSVYAPTYRVKVQNIYYVVRSHGFKYQCPKCRQFWHPNVAQPTACPKCSVKFGWKVRLGMDLRPWFIPLGVSVEISR